VWGWSTLATAHACHLRWSSSEPPACLRATNDLWVADGFFGNSSHLRPVWQTFGGMDCVTDWYNTTTLWVTFRPL
jgi:hypothetical protein